MSQRAANEPAIGGLTAKAAVFSAFTIAVTFALAAQTAATGVRQAQSKIERAARTPAPLPQPARAQEDALVLARQLEATYSAVRAARGAPAGAISLTRAGARRGAGAADRKADLIAALERFAARNTQTQASAALAAPYADKIRNHAKALRAAKTAAGEDAALDDLEATLRELRAATGALDEAPPLLME